MNRRDFSRLVAAVVAAGTVAPLRADDVESRSLPAYAGPWMPLFNGVDLSGWSFYQDGVGTTDKTNAVVVEQGEIRMLGPRHTGGGHPGFGHIATVRECSDYHLRLEYKFGDARFEPRLLAKRNSGVLYHMFPERDRVWPNSIEFQLEESDVGDAILINARCYPGADLGGTPAWPNQVPMTPKPAFPRPEGARPPLERQLVRKSGDFETRMDWNTIELLAIGDKAAHLVNGRIVNSLYELEAQEVADRNVYRPLKKGRIALEIEAAEVSFRRVEIRQFDVGSGSRSSPP
jgi:hypothetical protein